jgi:hypothetical protein
MEGHFLFLRCLCSIGVNTHQARSNILPSPLQAAIEEGALPGVRWLTHSTVRTATLGAAIATPLFYAAAESSVDVVRALVEEGGASLEVRDDCGRTAIDWAKGCASDVRCLYVFYLLTAGVEVVYFHLITLTHTPQAAGPLWTRDRPVAETST